MNLSRYRPKRAKDQWKTISFPEKNARLNIDKIFNKKQWTQIRHGLTPEKMEDKWFIYEENTWLFIHRSWTGHCIYKIRFEVSAGTLKIVEAYANRDNNQYKVTDNNYDSQFILWIIERFLLDNENYPFPSLHQKGKRHLRSTRQGESGFFSHLFPARTKL